MCSFTCYDEILGWDSELVGPVGIRAYLLNYPWNPILTFSGIYLGSTPDPSMVFLGNGKIKVPRLKPYIWQYFLHITEEMVTVS